MQRCHPGGRSPTHLTRLHPADRSKGRAGVERCYRNPRWCRLGRDSRAIEPRSRFHIGCTGWSVHGSLAARFPGPGTHLQRYARGMPAVEITSSFYRPHRRSTYERWAAAVPAGFRFAVKLPREISHERRLIGALPAFDAFLDQVQGLGDALGPLLIQLPPSLAFAPAEVSRFLNGLRRRHGGDVVCEPRHPSWFASDPERLLVQHRVARVAADPARVAAAGRPGGWDGVTYVRLHGSPVMYRSAYDDAFLEGTARMLEQRTGPVWCFFDNTMLNAALPNALALRARLAHARPLRPR